MSSYSSISKAIFLFAAGFVTLFLAGCAASSTSGVQGGLTGSNASGSSTPAASMIGYVHGGKQAIYNATVSLYEMNTSTANYGDTPILAAHTTTGYNGSFSFTRAANGGTASGATYACPSGASTGTPGSAADPEMYLVSSGGDTSGTITVSNVASAYNNAHAKFILAIGDCNSLSASTQVVMNEITTVGTMVALQQFFNPMTEAIGSPSTNVTGLVNSIAMISNLVSIANGAVQQSVTPASTVPGITITATPEFQKMNTIANILAACVSSNPTVSATACTALSTNAVPPASSAVTNFSTITSYPSATDTLLAVDYMSINPTESQDYYAGTGKLYNLYSLPSTSTAPYSPALAAQPMDWTVGIVFVPSGTCTNTTASGTPEAFLSSEYSVAIDKNGNILMGGSGSGDVLAEINPQGAAINCLNSGGTGNSAGRELAIDSQGNVWWATSQGLLEFVTDTGNTAVGTLITHPQPSGFKVSGLAADQHGNIFVAPDATSSTLYEYVGAATATSAVTPVSIGTLALSASGYPYRNLVVNAAGYLVTEGSGGNYVYTYSPATTTTTKATTTTGGSTVYGAAGASDGTTVIGNSCCARAGGLLRINPTLTATSAMTSYSPLFAGGQNADRGIAVDGADNIWTGGATYGNDSTGTLNAVGESDKNYNPLSPQGVEPPLVYSTAGNYSPGDGDCGASTGATAADECQVQGGFMKPFFYLNSIYGMAIDGSGNVWGAPDSSTVGQINYWVIVGAAVPLKTPIVSNLH